MATWHQPFLEGLMRHLGLRFQGVATIIVSDELGNEWHCGAGEPENCVRAPGYELMRAMFSRWSRRQIAAWAWANPPASAAIDSFGLFGPRGDDQPVPPPN